MKHKELVNLAMNYLLSAKQCNPVFTERGSARISEMPDAIGWNSECIIIECKVSIDDLKKDIKKSFRKDKEKGLGNRRFYLLPVFLYEHYVKNKEADYIPKGWGILVVVDNKQIRQIRLKGSSKFKSNIKAERDYLRSRILQVQRFGR